jgi:hypothetical protein
MWRDLLEGRMNILRAQGPDKLKLRLFEVGSGIADSVVEQIVREAAVSLSADLLQFYREMNGVIANWSWYPKGEEIYGSIHIVSLQTALFGFNEMIERSEYEDAWKDSLWNTESFSVDSMRELKEHRVFESISGAPSYVTFKPSPDATDLLYVNEEDISPIRVPFTEYLRIVLEHLGASSIREHLAKDDWEDRIRVDEKLKAVRGLR